MRIPSTLIAAAIAWVGTPAHADASFHVDLDTTALQASASGPFELYFQFNDGSAVGDANNVVSLSRFDFGTGAGVGAPLLDGGASGALAIGFTLVDNSFYNAVTQSFSVGRSLGFDVTLTTQVDPGGTPDEFSFALIDGSGNLVTTTALGNALLVVDIDGATPAVQTFAGTGDYAGLGVPQIGQVGVVPEPGLPSMLGAGAAFLIWRRGANRQNHAR